MLDAIDFLMASHVKSSIRQIVLSTWFGEIERFENLSTELKKRNVVCVVSSEPVEFRASPERYTARGHVFHQMLALKRGIGYGARDGIVLKTRPDLKLHQASDLESMLAIDSVMPISAELRPFSALVNRVRVEKVSPVYPFYIMDTHFIASKHDLITMSDFYAGYDFVYNIHNAIPEIRFFHAPFRGRFRIIEDLLTVPYLILKFEQDGRHEQMLGVLLKDRFFLKGLVAYWSIIANFFEISSLAEGECPIDALVAELRADFGPFVDDTLLREVLDFVNTSPHEAMARFADPNFSSPEEFQACAKKLAAIAMQVQPRIVVDTADQAFSLEARGTKLPLSAPSRMGRGVDGDSNRSWKKYVRKLSRALEVDCCFGRPDVAGVATVHGIIGIDFGQVLWRSRHEAHIRMILSRPAAEEEVKVIPIHTDITSDYFFQEALRFNGDEVIRVTVEISIEGEVLGKSWSFEVDRHKVLDRETRLMEERRTMRKTFFDVGANSGQNSLHLAGNNEWEVYAFEPTPQLYMQLKERTKDFDNYHLFQCAVSDKPGRLKFKVAGQGDWGTSSLLSFGDDVMQTWNGRTDFHVTEEIEVSVISLRDFVDEHDIAVIDVLHTDVQGVDLEVLQGLGDKISIVRTGMMETARDHNVKLYKDQRYVLEDCTLFLYQNGFLIKDLHYNDERGHIPTATASLYSANEINIVYERR